MPGPIYTPGPVVGRPMSQHADGDPVKYQRALAAVRANADPTPNVTNGNYDPSDIYAANAYNYGALQNLGPKAPKKPDVQAKKIAVKTQDEGPR